ncbi:MAG: thiamine-phosphate kinase [Acidobacteriota bacterium]
MKSEFEFIDTLRVLAGSVSRPSDLIAGIGDDTAILSTTRERELLITTDLLNEGIHFDLNYTTPTLLGHKALAVNLSDIAAMGGRASYFLLSLARPVHISDQFLEEMIAGMLALAKSQDILLIGGDTSRSPDRLFINITAIGECPAGNSIRRNGAQAGDLIFVSGSLGAAARGLELLRSGRRLNDTLEIADLAAIRAQLAPQPRVALGAVLGARQLANAMIDISDGLSSDLSHICQESGVGAEIEATAIPIAEGASLAQALNGGEDYELLFTVNPARSAEIDQLRRELPDIELNHIGVITSERERWLIEDKQKRALIAQGYDHFASQR